MKYIHKCPQCHRKATKRYHNLFVCEECYRYDRRTNAKKRGVVYEEVLIGSFGQGCSLYAIVERKIK